MKDLVSQLLLLEDKYGISQDTQIPEEVLLETLKSFHTKPNKSLSLASLFTLIIQNKLQYDSFIASQRVQEFTTTLGNSIDINNNNDSSKNKKRIFIPGDLYSDNENEDEDEETKENEKMETDMHDFSINIDHNNHNNNINNNNNINKNIDDVFEGIDMNQVDDDDYNKEDSDSDFNEVFTSYKLNSNYNLDKATSPVNPYPKQSNLSSNNINGNNDYPNDSFIKTSITPEERDKIFNEVNDSHASPSRMVNMSTMPETPQQNFYQYVYNDTPETHSNLNRTSSAAKILNPLESSRKSPSDSVNISQKSSFTLNNPFSHSNDTNDFTYDNQNFTFNFGTKKVEKLNKSNKKFSSTEPSININLPSTTRFSNSTNSSPMNGSKSNLLDNTLFGHMDLSQLYNNNNDGDKKTSNIFSSDEKPGFFFPSIPVDTGTPLSKPLFNISSPESSGVSTPGPPIDESSYVNQTKLDDFISDFQKMKFPIESESFNIGAPSSNMSSKKFSRHKHSPRLNKANSHKIISDKDKNIPPLFPSNSDSNIDDSFLNQMDNMNIKDDFNSESSSWWNNEPKSEPYPPRNFQPQPPTEPTQPEVPLSARAPEVPLSARHPEIPLSARAPEVPLSSRLEPEEPMSARQSDIPFKPEQFTRPNNSNIDLEIADMYSKQGKEFYLIGAYEKAIEKYTSALQAAPIDWPSSPTIIGNRAASYFMLNNFIDCINDCDKALQGDPALLRLHIRKAKAFIKIGYYKEALESYKKLFEFNYKDLPPFIQRLHPIKDNNPNFITKDELDEGTRGEIEVKKYRELESKLFSLENDVFPSTSPYTKGSDSVMLLEKLLKVTYEILEKSPFHRKAQCINSRVLLCLGKYDEVKDYIEKITMKSNLSIQSHYSDNEVKFFDCSNIKSDLKWVVEGNDVINVDLTKVTKFMIYLGSEMSKIYLNALKNQTAVTKACNDSMEKISSLLSSLVVEVNNENFTSWDWLEKEEKKIKKLILNKNQGDNYFKLKNFENSLKFYNEAINLLDPNLGSSTFNEYRKWLSVLYCNRAATKMSLSLYEDAITDCNRSLIFDCNFQRAFLRRARSYRSLNRYEDSTADYKAYLSSNPQPSDYSTIKSELETYITSHNMKQNKTRQEANNKNYSNYNKFGTNNNAKKASSYFDEFDYTNMDEYYYYSRMNNKNKPNKNIYTNNNQYAPKSDANYSSYTSRQNNTYSSSNYSNSNSNNTNNYKSSTSTSSSSSSGPDFNSKDYYKVLGIASQATEKQIKDAFRKLALIHHPDKSSDPQSEEIFKKINLAYSTLSNIETRRTYDLSRPRF